MSEMTIHLMFRDKNFDIEEITSPWRDTLMADLQIERILEAMSRGNKSVYKSCYAAMFSPLLNPDEIKYRQEVLEDARRFPEAIEAMFEIVDEAMELHNKDFRKMPASHVAVIYHNTITHLRNQLDYLSALRRTADKAKSGFKTDMLRGLCEMLHRELADSYLKPMDKRLHDLFSGEDAMISASLGEILQGVDYKTRKIKFLGITSNWLTAPVYSVPDSSVTSNVEKKELALRTDLAMDDLTVALRQSAEYVGCFMEQLRDELGFYLGCMRLEETITKTGMPMCTPTFNPVTSTKHEWRGLFDVSLCIARNDKVIGCDINIEGKKLFIITGANQGGKSTYLRGIGQARIMSQCGMNVAGESFNTSLRVNLFTHFKKEEDASMKSGKLDEELARMRKLADNLTPGCTVMLNESFASTNEREGSEICRQITQAMMENGVEVYSVSHMYVYSMAFMGRDDTMHLRAQRLEGGERTFRIEVGEPLVTAFGGDLYLAVFGREL